MSMFPAGLTTAIQQSIPMPPQPLGSWRRQVLQPRPASVSDWRAMVILLRAYLTAVRSRRHQRKDPARLATLRKGSIDFGPGIGIPISFGLPWLEISLRRSPAVAAFCGPGYAAAARRFCGWCARTRCTVDHTVRPIARTMKNVL